MIRDLGCVSHRFSGWMFPLFTLLAPAVTSLLQSIYEVDEVTETHRAHPISHHILVRSWVQHRHRVCVTMCAGHVTCSAGVRVVPMVCPLPDGHGQEERGADRDAVEHWKGTHLTLHVSALVST